MTDAPSQDETKQEGCLTRFSNYVIDHLETGFVKWGRIVQRFPIVIIVGAICILIAMIYGFATFKTPDDPSMNWIPKNARVRDDKDTVEDVFNGSNRLQAFYVTAKDEGDDLLTLNAYNELILFDSQFKQVKSGEDKTYEDYCYKIEDEDPCEPIDHPLEFVEISQGVFSLEGLTSDEDLVDRIQTGKGPTYAPSSSEYINVDQIFGGTNPGDVTQNDDSGQNDLSKAKAMTLRYLILGDADMIDDYEEWDPDIEDWVEDFNDDAKYIKVYAYTTTAVRRGMNAGIVDEILYVQIGLALIIVYSLLVLGRTHPFRSRTALAMSGVMGVAFAYIEAIGLGTYIGLEVTGIVQALPFVLLGIGVDDMYVLIQTMEQIDYKKGVEARMEHMMKHAGVSITTTSLTSLFCFAVSSSTSLPALSDFWAFASLGIFFDYFNQITFFTACVVLDERRMHRPCGDCCGLCLCAPASVLCCRGKFFADEEGNEIESGAQKFMREKYGPFLTKFPVKIVVVVCFAILVSVMAYGVSTLENEFDFEWFLNEDDHVQDAIDVRDKYFDDEGSQVKIYTVDTDFSKESTQRALIELAENMQDWDGCSENWVEDGTLKSWYSELNDWVGSDGCVDQGQVVKLQDGVIPQNNFFYCARTWYDMPGNSRYRSKVKWNDDKAYIDGAAMTAVIKQIDNSEDAVDAMDDTRDITDDDGPGDSFPYSRDYLGWETFAVFERETALSLGLSCLMAFIILVILTADFRTAAIVLLMVGITDICILGLMAFWGSELNAVTIANIVIAVGISVDYNAHIAIAFNNAQGTRDERVIIALDTVGISVLHGAFSTFLAILALVGSKTYIFTSFSQAFFGIVIFGGACGLILLPVLLSWIGKPSKSRTKISMNNQTEDQQKGQIAEGEEKLAPSEENEHLSDENLKLDQADVQ